MRFPLHSGFQEFSRRKKKSGKKKKKPCSGPVSQAGFHCSPHEKMRHPKGVSCPGAACPPWGLRRGSWRQCVCPSLTLLWAQQRTRAHPWERPLLASHGCCGIPWHCIARQRTVGRAGLCSLVPQRLTCWSHGGHAAPVMMEGKVSAGPRGCCRPCRVLLTPRMPVELTQFAVSCFPANVYLQK